MKHEFNETADFNEDMTFGEVLRKTRRLLGLNQTDMGEYLGYGFDQHTISRYELNKNTPPFEFARELLKTMGFEVKIVRTEKEIENVSCI